MTIQLTVEEALAYQKFDERMKGYVEGVQAAVNYFRQSRIQEILAARKPPSGDIPATP